MIFDLQIRAQLENISQFAVAKVEEFSWNIMFKCTGCGEERDTFRVLSLAEKYEGKSGRGEFHLVEKCHFCGRCNSVDIVEKSSNVPYLECDSGKFKSVCSLDCRGLEPSKYKFGGGYRVSAANSKTVFDEVAFEDQEWTEYDAEAKESVEILELDYQFVKRK